MSRLRLDVEQQFYTDGLWRLSGRSMEIAREAEDPLPFFVISQVLRMIAADRQDRPLGASVAASTRRAIVPGVQGIIDEALDWPNSLAMPQLLSELIRALFDSDYRNTSLS